MDDISPEVKQRRLQEIIDVHRAGVYQKNPREESNKLRLVLVEGHATKSTPENPLLTGRTDGGKRVVFSARPVRTTLSQATYEEAMALFRKSIDDAVDSSDNNSNSSNSKDNSDCADDGNCWVLPDATIGSYVAVHIIQAGGPTLRGYPVAVSGIVDFAEKEATLTTLQYSRV